MSDVRCRVVTATPVTSATAVTTLSPVVGALSQVGDVLYMVVILNRNGAQTWTVPSGWLKILEDTSSTPSLVVFAKVCASADIGASKTVSWSSSGAGLAVIVPYLNCDTTDYSDPGTFANNASSTTDNWPACAVLHGMGALLFAIGHVANTTPPVRPAPTTGFVTAPVSTARASGVVSTLMGYSIGEIYGLPAGSYPSATATAGVAGVSHSLSLPLRPAVGPTARSAAVSSSSIAVPSVTATLPSKWEIGDLQTVVFTIGDTTNAITVTPPSGWVLEAGPFDVSLKSRTFVYSRVMPSGAASDSFTLSATATGGYLAVSTAWAGAASAVESVAVTLTGTNATLSMPAITSTVDNSTIVYTGIINGSSTVTSITSVGQATVTTSFGSKWSAGQFSETSAEPQARNSQTFTVAPNETNNYGIVMVIPPVASPPTVRSVASTLAASGSSIVDLGSLRQATTVIGDTIVQVIQSDATAPTPPSVTPPWVLVGSDNSANPSVYVYARTATGDTNDGGPYSGMTSAATKSAMQIVFEGAVTIDDITFGAVVTSATQTEVASTPAGDDSLLLNACAFASLTDELADPAGSVLMLHKRAPTDCRFSVVYEIGPGNGVATATQTWTVGISTAGHPFSMTVRRTGPGASQQTSQGVTRQAVR